MQLELAVGGALANGPHEPGPFMFEEIVAHQRAGFSQEREVRLEIPPDRRVIVRAIEVCEIGPDLESREDAGGIVRRLGKRQNDVVHARVENVGEELEVQLRIPIPVS
jgi:hypothetical protein